MKKALSVLVVMAMVLAMIPAGVIVASAEQEGDYTYAVADSEATIIGYTGTGGDITIPSALGGYPVTSIGNNAFSYCSSLTAVTIPESITKVGDHAFDACDGITLIEISDKVTSIGYGAFGSCGNLTQITVSAANENLFKFEWRIIQQNENIYCSGTSG